MTQSPSPIPVPAGVGITALIVAQKRAEESLRPDRLIDDPLAGDFVRAAGTIPDLFPKAALPEAQRETLETWRRDWIASRTRFFDDDLLSAAGAGCRQVVIPGAGLDTRAFRLAWPEGTRVFELDLPDVLAFKERVLAERNAVPRCERHVLTVDLREDWPAVLRAAGFEDAAPTAWLVEGLLMYLTEPERDVLLGRIGALSAGGSALALEHRPPGGKTADGSEASLADPAAWLAGHGWDAGVLEPRAALAAYGRAAPPSSNPMAAVLLQGWLASGVLRFGTR